MQQSWTGVVPTLATLWLVSLGACNASENAHEEGVDDVVPADKADDYFSPEGQEYTVTGTISAQVDDLCLSQRQDADDPLKTCILETITLKNFATGWFLNRYMLDKDGGPEEWGGFTAMTRPESFEALEVSELDENNRFTYTFTSELSGPFNLLERVPNEVCGAERCFTLEMAALEYATLRNLEPGDEWYRRPTLAHFNPAEYTGAKESLTLRIKPYPRSNDAFLEYNKLFSSEQLAKADGALKIGVFIGFDYNTQRFDIRAAREMYDWLTTQQGFTSPVDSFEQLKLTSGDLTKTIVVRGRSIPVKVLLVHPGQGDPANPTFARNMRMAMVRAFGERQIITYSGHAGTLYGFNLGDWSSTSAGEIDDTDLVNLSIPANFYQIVLAGGCDTYMVADSLYLNPVKQGRTDLDIITSSSFASLGTLAPVVQALLGAAVNQDGDNGELAPRKYGEMLRAMNTTSSFTPMFGVHGIDDNPRFNPFVDPNISCTPCSSSDDCGEFDTKCIRTSVSEPFCAVTCESDTDCLDGYGCFPLRQGDAIVGRACVPRTLTCEQPDAPAPTLWINELHYDNVDPDAMEGVEIAGTAGTDLNGYSVVFYDGASDRGEVYDSVTLEGRVPGQQANFGTVWIAREGIKDGGADDSPAPDGVALVNARGEVVDFISYEGSFTAQNGPAAGMTSTDIGVSELSTGSATGSVGLVGTGASAKDFTWMVLDQQTPGEINPGQTLQ